MRKEWNNLQLFAEGGETAGSDGGAAARAEETTGANSGASDAGMQNAAAESGEKPSFDELIQGEYRDAFGKRVQEIIRRRFRGNAENAERLEKIAPILETLGKRYGVDPTDIDQIAKAMEEGADEGEPERDADSREAGRTQLERQRMADMRIRDHFDRLTRQAEAAREIYPGLNLREEMRNPIFARLTSPESGIDVRTAYEVAHREALRGAEMQFAAQKSAERAANAIRSGSMRPEENGLNGWRGAGAMQLDPAALTQSDRAEIRRRVQRGEKIVF